MPSAKPSLKAMAHEAKSKKKSAPPKKTTKPPPAPSNFKSAELVQESEEEEDDKSDNASDSDDESFPDNFADGGTELNGKLPAPSGSSSESESESEGGSDESSDEEEEEQIGSSRKAVVEPETQRQRPKEPSARTVAIEKPPPYNPPTGFEAASIDRKSAASQLLRKSALKGKQVWYFTAPTSIPISTIEQMSMLDADTGKAVLNHNGSDYGFVQDSSGDKMYTKIMVPSDSDDAYITAPNPIDRMLHLQQIVKLPGITDSGTSATSSSRATVTATKPIRQQPKGLKMRFRPIGFGKGETGKIGVASSSGDASSTESASDEEMGNTPAVFRRPELEEAEEDEDNEMEDAPPPSSKPKSKSKTAETPKKAKTSSLKRKHAEEGSQPAKKSSSEPIDPIDGRELKRLKKKQKEPHTSRADNRSVSAEAHDAMTISNSQYATPISHDTVSSPNWSKSSQGLEVKEGPESKLSSHKHSKKRSRDSEITPARATDPNLAGEERRKKITKLKHKDSK